jgi:archaemetzincin
MEKLNAKKTYKIETPKTYGPNKFQIPAKETKFRAMDYDKLDDKLKHLLIKDLDDFYSEIRVPTKSDWLWDHKETGQTYKIYITGMYNSPSKTFNTVYINNLDVGLENSFLDDSTFDHLKTLIELYYPGLKAKMLPKSQGFEQLGITKRFNSPYIQYNASQCAEKLPKILPKDGLLIIGLTSYDLYPAEEWNFVFGLANKQTGCGVFSFRRYYDEFEESSDKNRLMTKFAGRVMLHELGHLLGIKHCIYYNCLMNGSNHMKENFDKPFEVCPVCLRKLIGNLKFDVVDRFEGLAGGLEKLDKDLYEKEIEWYRKRINSLL